MAPERLALVVLALHPSLFFVLSCSFSFVSFVCFVVDAVDVSAARRS
jgi:hypothetical protein